MKDCNVKLPRTFYAYGFQTLEAIIWWNLLDGTAFADEDIYKGALLRDDMSEKPVYTMLDNLINKEWKTTEVVKPDENGEFNFRGFYGEYEVTVHNRNTTSYKCSLTKDNKNVEL